MYVVMAIYTTDSVALSKDGNIKRQIWCSPLIEECSVFNRNGTIKFIFIIICVYSFKQKNNFFMHCVSPLFIILLNYFVIIYFIFSVVKYSTPRRATCNNMPVWLYC